ncbi:hypothetical protein BH23GEM5_BH23GEM5_02080 [soil metagenome]|jgi:hypothetical protein
MKPRTHGLLISLLSLALPAGAQSIAPTENFVPKALSSLTVEKGPWIMLHTAGGTLVGAWLGYMTSQVKYSDWDRDKTVDLGEKRRKHTIYGAGLGSIAGFTVSLGVGARPSQPFAIPAPRAPHGQQITRADIEEAGSANAYDLVQTLRPNWLHERGTHSMRETTRAQSEGNSIRLLREGDPTIVAYLNEALLGPVDRLRDIPAVTIHSIRYHDAAAATHRWGAGHTHGVIQILTQAETR